MNQDVLPGDYAKGVISLNGKKEGGKYINRRSSYKFMEERRKVYG